jgi:uncharacterized membrane protein
MTSSTVGLIVGLLLAIAAVIGGFPGFLLALVLGTVGYVVGASRDGEIDLNALLRGKGRG